MMENTIAQRLEAHGIILPTASQPAAQYTNYVKVNGLLFVSGKGPSGGPKGKLGKEYTTREGYNFARLTGIEILAVVQAALGSLELVKQVVNYRVL